MTYRFLVAWLVVLTVSGQQALIDKIDADAMKRWVTESFAAAMQAHGNNPEMLVRRGVVADRQARRVEIQALATGMGQEPCEFFLVATYGRDYEALAVSMAQPNDIHAALEFIGVPPGRPIDYRQLLYWPKGERVIMTFEWDDEVDGETVTRSLRAEDAVLHLEKEQTLPRTGLMFTGSRMVKTADDGEEQYGANLGGEIASDYNDQWAVLDVPYRAEQGDVYGLLVPAKAAAWEVGQRLRVVLVPKLPRGETAVRDVALHLSGHEQPDGAADLRFTLSMGGDVVLQSGMFEAFLSFLGEQKEAGHDLFLTISFEPSLPVGPLHELMEMVQALADRDVIRLEPRDDQLYYRAFLPEPHWRNRAERLVQPLEIYLAPDGTGRLVILEETYVNGEPNITDTVRPFSDRAQLLALVAEREEWQTDTWFAFAAPGVTYGQIMEVHQQLRDRFPVVFVFAPLTGNQEAAPPVP